MRVLLLVALLTGCSAYQPRENPWPEVSATADSAARPHDLPPWPTDVVVLEGRAAFSEEATRTLEQFRQLAVANTDIAEIHARQVDALREAVDEYVRAGRAEHELAELRARMLEEERRSQLWDRWLWLGLGLVGIAVTN